MVGASPSIKARAIEQFKTQGSAQTPKSPSSFKRHTATCHILNANRGRDRLENTHPLSSALWGKPGPLPQRSAQRHQQVFKKEESHVKLEFQLIFRQRDYLNPKIIARKLY